MRASRACASGGVTTTTRSAPSSTASGSATRRAPRSPRDDGGPGLRSPLADRPLGREPARAEPVEHLEVGPENAPRSDEADADCVGQRIALQLARRGETVEDGAGLHQETRDELLERARILDA